MALTQLHIDHVRNLRQLRLQYPLVAVGPNTTDTRAIATYAKAGFRKRRLAPTKDGKLVQVMTHL